MAAAAESGGGVCGGGDGEPRDAMDRPGPESGSGFRDVLDGGVWVARHEMERLVDVAGGTRLGNEVRCGDGAEGWASVFWVL